MPVRNNSEKGFFYRALFSAIFLMVAWFFVRYNRSAAEQVPLRGHFSDFPMKLREWSGRELGLPDEILNVLKVDDYMRRVYVNDLGRPLELYVGYYQSQRSGATYHSPKNCLPGNGWSIIQTVRTHLAVPGRGDGFVQVNQFMIQKGSQKQWVLYWYNDRGRVIANEYRAKLYLVFDAAVRNRTDGALVRVSIPIDDDEEIALNEGKAFAERIFPLLQEYLPA